MLESLDGKETISVFGLADPMAEEIVVQNFRFASRGSRYEQVSGDVLNAVFAHFVTSTERFIRNPDSGTEGQVGISALVGPMEAPFSGGLVRTLQSIGMNTDFIRHLPQDDLAHYILKSGEKGSKSYGFLGRGHCPSRYMFADRRYGEDLHPEEHHKRLQSVADIIYVSLITAAVINKPDKQKLIQFAKEFHQAGKTLVLDTNFREALSEYWDRTLTPVKCLRELAKYASVILAGAEDLEGMGIIKSSDPHDKQVKTSFQFFWRQNREALVILKNGEDGIYFRLPNDEKIHIVKGLSTLQENEFVDSVGAGDAFGGGTVTGLIEHRDIDPDPEVAIAIIAIAHGAALKCLHQRGAGLTDRTESFLVECRNRLGKKSESNVEDLNLELFKN